MDAGLYALSAAFAGFTAVGSTLPAHRAWGQLAVFGYAAAALAIWPARRYRTALTWLTWLAVALVPLVVEAVQRAGGRAGRAQEEVLVIEDGGWRLLHAGTPYLDVDSIAATPDRLLAYMPYQPGMALFGLARAVFGAHWWTDARVWFAVVTAAAVVTALRVLKPPEHESVRAAQAVTVLPIAALTLATGGDDLPVLALALLGLAFAARGRDTAAGLAVGVAASMKLFAFPVLIVMAVLLRSRRYLLPAIGLPVLTLLPVLLVNPGAVVENVIRFPFGHGLVSSPAASPFPGHLIAAAGARPVAIGLLLAAGVAIAVWLWRRPPRTAGAASGVIAVGLLAAILLMPATRFGYLLYPAAFGLWIPAYEKS